MKKFVALLLSVTMLLGIAPMRINAEAKEPLEYQITEYKQSRIIAPFSSAVLDETSWGFSKNECVLVYSFQKSTSGSVTATLQKENSNGTWTDIASKYHTFSFTTITSTEISVSSLSTGNYRVKTDVYAVIAGTLYTEGKLTGTKRLY